MLLIVLSLLLLTVMAVGVVLANMPSIMASVARKAWSDSVQQAADLRDYEGVESGDALSEMASLLGEPSYRQYHISLSQKDGPERVEAGILVWADVEGEALKALVIDDRIEAAKIGGWTDIIVESALEDSVE
ncbi:MAG: hypothetical protein JXP37_05540 [Coriobacteriia bacterium]|nr:hypothetical protein [Coriobacteriia bacterium]